MAVDPSRVPASRIRALVDRPVREEGDYILYWMTSARRLGWNYALDRSIELAREARRPLIVLEALRCDYPWSSARLHRFVLDGMASNRLRAEGAPIVYYPYVETERGAGRGLLAALARNASAVVTDDFPSFFLPHMLAAATAAVDGRLEVVDSNGLLPLSVTDKEFVSAYAFRRFLHAALKPHLGAPPLENPLPRAGLPRLARIPEEIERRWPVASERLLAGEDALLDGLPLQEAVAPVDDVRGGAYAAERALESFLDRKLARYADDRNEPDADAGSGLSPFLHFGHLAAHHVLARLAAREGWTPETLPPRGSGSREGWWGMSPAAESFLDELVTWRELGYVFCFHRPDYDRYESLPDWARSTLEAHERDPRRWIYSLEQFESSSTHDPLWNAAQRQLRREGRMHNYLRMLWGKKILEWTESPRRAIEVLIQLNNKYALDGRNPNSYTGIFWCLGRFDRPWAPERPVVGTVRTMSSENARRKLHVEAYLERYGEQPSLL